jgi:hypothetical protein
MKSASNWLDGVCEGDGGSPRKSGEIPHVDPFSGSPSGRRRYCAALRTPKPAAISFALADQGAVEFGDCCKDVKGRDFRFKFRDMNKKAFGVSARALWGSSQKRTAHRSAEPASAFGLSFPKIRHSPSVAATTLRQTRFQGRSNPLFEMVEPDGIEPTTSSMPLKRSPN